MLPPYPLLVTVGQDDDGLHLVNLEHLGVVALAGDPERAKALARHIAAELALNPWSAIVEVNVIGLGEELAPLDTLRLRHHEDGEQVVPDSGPLRHRFAGERLGRPRPVRRGHHDRRRDA